MGAHMQRFGVAWLEVLQRDHSPRVGKDAVVPKLPEQCVLPITGRTAMSGIEPFCTTDAAMCSSTHHDYYFTRARVSTQ